MPPDNYRLKVPVVTIDFSTQVKAYKWLTFTRKSVTKNTIMRNRKQGLAYKYFGKLLHLQEALGII